MGTTHPSTDQIIAVSYTAKGDAIVAENPRVWLAKQVGADWDVSPDGMRVVVVGTLDAPGESRAGAKQEHEMVMKCGVIHGHDQSSIGRFFDSGRQASLLLMLLNFSNKLRRKVPVAKKQFIRNVFVG